MFSKTVTKETLFIGLSFIDLIYESTKSIEYVFDNSSANIFHSLE